MQARGRLITLEGIDGAGKSTLARSLAHALAERGRAVRVLREPGGVRASERIRELVKDPQLSLGPRAEALLYAAARAQLVEETLRPALEGGGWVLLDRFVDSSLAYQGAGRDLGMEAVAAVNEFATGALRADRTLLLDVSVGEGLSRARGRGEPADRLEREASPFFERIAGAYRELARREPQRIRVLDASRPEGEVLEQALRELEDLLGG